MGWKGEETQRLSGRRDTGRESRRQPLRASHGKPPNHFGTSENRNNVKEGMKDIRRDEAKEKKEKEKQTGAGSCLRGTVSAIQTGLRLLTGTLRRKEKYYKEGAGRGRGMYHEAGKCLFFFKKTVRHRIEEKKGKRGGCDRPGG